LSNLGLAVSVPETPWQPNLHCRAVSQRVTLDRLRNHRTGSPNHSTKGTQQAHNYSSRSVLLPYITVGSRFTDQSCSAAYLSLMFNLV